MAETQTPEQIAAEQQALLNAGAAVGGYTPSTTGTAAGATQGVQAWLPNLTAPMPSINQGLPDDLASASWDTGTVQTGGHPKGYGKGERFEALSRIADLLQIAHAADTGVDMSDARLNQGAVSDIFGQLGEYRVPTTALGIQTSAGGREPGQNPKVAVRAIQDVVKHLDSMGVMLTAAQAKVLDHVTNPSQVLGALNELKNVQLPSSLTQTLKADGYGDVSTVEDVVGQHNQLFGGAPGAPHAIPGRPEKSINSASADYADLVKKWNSGVAGQNSTMQELSAAGLLTPNADGSPPATDQVQAAMQELISKSIDAKTTPDKTLQSLVSANPLSQSANESFIERFSKVAGVNLTQPQLLQILAGYNNANSTGTNGADYVYNTVTALAQNPQSGGSPLLGQKTGEYSGMANSIAQVVTSTYANYGLAPPTGDSMNQIIATVLGQSNLSSLYQVTDAAQAYAGQQAKDAASQKYQSIAPLIAKSDPAQGITGLMSSYQTQAADLLGVPASEINMTDPKWMTWTQGQNSQPMNSQEWAHTVMTNANGQNYGWLGSTGAKNAMAMMGEGVMNILGTQAVSPGTFSTVPGTVSSSQPTGGG